MSRRSLIATVYVVVVGVAGFFALRSQLDEISDRLERLSIAALTGSLALSLAALWCAMLAWRELLIGFGHTVPVRHTSEVFFLSQVGKYLPGSIWPALAQIEFGKDHGLPRKVNAWSFATAMGLSLLTGATVGLTASAFDRPLGLPLLGLAAIGLGLLGLWRFGSVLSARLPKVARLLPERWPATRSLVRAAALFSVHWLLQGLHLAVLLAAMEVERHHLVLGAIAAFPLAFVAGTLFVIAPAGLGVREGVLVSLLGIIGTASASATAASLVSRTVLTVADLIAAGLALLFSVRRNRAQTNRSGPP